MIVSNKCPFGKQDFKYFIGYKESKKIRPLCIFSLRMIIYKRNFDENGSIYFLTKEEKVFIKYMEALVKVINITKNKFNSEFIYSKKYLKTEKKKKTTQKGHFQCLYAPIILIDSVCKKDENYYPKVFLEKYYFIKNRDFL